MEQPSGLMLLLWLVDKNGQYCLLLAQLEKVKVIWFLELLALLIL
jgi:hypothetical protein